MVASFGTDAGSADSAAVAEDSAARAEGPSALVAPAAGSGEVVVVMSGVDHTSDRLDVTARELDDGTLDPIADLTAESPSLGPIATPIGARDVCRPRSASRADAGILVDVSEVDGVSAAVLGRALRRGPHGLGGRPLLHHRQHRPHPWPGVARLSPAGAAGSAVDRRGAAGPGTPRP